MSAKPKPLSRQHQRFIAEYRRVRVAWRAYALAYPRASAASAQTLGPSLLNDLRISSEIERLDGIEMKRLHMSADEVLSLAAQRTRANMADLFWKPGELDAAGNQIAPDRVGTRKQLHELPPEVTRCIREVEIVEDPRTRRVETRVKLLNPAPHETNIMKHHKLLTENLNVNITLGFSERLRAAREKRLKESK